MTLPIQSAPVHRTITGAPPADQTGAEQSHIPHTPIPFAGVEQSLFGHLYNPFAGEGDE